MYYPIRFVHLLACFIQVEKETSKMSFMAVYLALSYYSPPSPRGVLALSKYTYVVLWVDTTVAGKPITFGDNIDKVFSVTVYSKVKFKLWMFLIGLFLLKHYSSA